MSIEDQLSEAYKETSQKLHPPQELDIRIEQMHHQYLLSKEKAPAHSRRVWTRSILIVAALVVTVGFTSQYGLQMREGLLHMVFNVEPIVTYDAKAAKDIRERMKEIKRDLGIGERVLYYSAEMERLFPVVNKKLKLTPFAIITNPYIWLDHEKWANELNAEKVPLRLQELSLHGWTFAGGQKEGTSGGMLIPSNMALLEALKEKTQYMKTSEAWVPLLPEAELNPVYSTFYRNPARDQIIITAEIFKMETGIVKFSDLSEYEVIYIDDKKTTYMKTETYMISDSDQYQTLVWLESWGDVTVRYEIGTSATGVSKADILDIAHQILDKPAGGDQE
ncbi:hypothetical protein [Paenibacillus eucommiae]|uniref:DUF4367 domain-containing protein n=1 Tax=Paenibacillus eucommiae TaxID=1355755 RepID=A0ABS4IV80_9BACL|nr:hypothetical protein [Paenibacillus eucommiae]MBP1991493.1 hypothetical protein [Paenibacillus eucommiae]